MKREKLPDGTIVYSDSTGAGVVQRLAPGVLLVTSLGEFVVSFENGPIQDFDREIAAHGSLTLCVNLLERRGVANSSRKDWIEWAKRTAGKVDVHILMRSKMVAMAVSVMAMLAGQLRVSTYASVEEFERALARLAPSVRRLPPLPSRARGAELR